MAEIRFYKSAFDDKFETYTFDMNKTLQENVDLLCKGDFSEMVECYDSETGETFYAPIEENAEDGHTVVVVNGRSVSADYKVQETDLVNVMYIPLSGQNDVGSWAGAISGGATIGAVLFGIIGMIAGGVPGFVIGLAAGGLFGAYVGWGIQTYLVGPEQKTEIPNEDGRKQPDVRGAENQSLANNVYPFVFGKHLISPYVVADPYTEYTGEKGENAYVRAVFCAGYGPLKLTDFKLGDFFLAYNRSQGVERRTVINGVLKGYSTDEADDGDILDRWSNNDISIEILQHDPRNQNVNFGHLYPYKMVDQEINANLFYIKDELLQQAATVTYKGVSFPKNFRTNGVWFTESCPMAFTINLNAPSGLYAARSKTAKSGNTVTSSTEYTGIPLWFAVQWRFYNEGNSSPASDGSDYNSWHNVTTWNGTANSTLLQTYNHQAMVDDKNAHVGNVFDFETKVNVDKSPIEIDEYVDKLSYFYAPYSDISVTNVFLKFKVSIGTKFLGIFKSSDFYIGNYLNPDRDNVLFDKKNQTLYIDAYNKIEDVEDGVTALIGEERDVFDTIAIDDESFTISDARNLIDERGSGTDTTVTVKYLKIAKNFFLAEKETVSTISDFWANKKLVNFQTLSGTNGKDQLRIRGTVEFSKEDCKKMLNPSNRIKGVEVRVVRVSPNYLNQEQKNEESDYPKYGTYSYSDVINVESIVTKCFDENKLRNEDVLEAVPIQSEADMKKFCYIAIKAKADTGGNLINQLKQLNCMAESFSPVWDSDNKKWLPENVHKKIDYYGYFADGGESDGEAFPDETKVYFIKDNNDYVYVSTVPEEGTQLYYGTDRLNTSTEGKVSKELYEFGRGKGFDWYKEDCGSDFGDKIRDEVFSETVETKNGCPCSYLPDSAKIFNDATSASGFMLGCVGPQNGKYADGYENINVTSVGEWWEDCQSVKDGSTYNVDDGVHNAGDDVVVKFEANGFITQSQKKETVLKDIALTGRAVFTYDETGRIKVIMDKPVDYVDGVINANNCIEETNSFSYAEPPAGLRIAYDDENDGYTQNSLYCWADGNDLTSYRGIVRPYQFKYVTNPYHAHSLGRYFLACECLKKHILTEKVGREGRLFPLGSVVLVQSNELLLGDGSARIQEVIEDGEYLYGFVTDKAIDYKEETEVFDGVSRSVKGVEIFQPKQFGKSRVVTLRLALVGTKVLNNKYEMKQGTTNLFLFAEHVIRYTGEDYSDNSGRYIFKTGDIVMFGTMEKISVKYRVIKVKPDEKGTFTHTFNLYDEALYNYGAKLPVFQNKMILPPTPEEMLPLNETVSNVRESLEENAKIMNETRSTVNAKFIEIIATRGLVFKNNAPAQLPLTVNATGFTPATYKWYKDGVELSEATESTYNATQAGVYKVVADNEYEDYATVISVIDGEWDSVYQCVISKDVNPKMEVDDADPLDLGNDDGELEVESKENRTECYKIEVYKDGDITSETLYGKWRYEKFKEYIDSTPTYDWTEFDNVTIENGVAYVRTSGETIRQIQCSVYKNNNYDTMVCTGIINDGKPASYHLVPSSNTIKSTFEGTYSPSELTLNANQTVSSEPGTFEGFFKIFYSLVPNPTNNDWTLAYSSQSHESSHTWTIAPSGIQLIKCQLYADELFTNLLEEDILPTTTDGKDSKGYNVSLSNENFSIPTDAEELKPLANTSVTVEFTAYKGADKLDATTGNTILPSQFKMTFPQSQGGITITQDSQQPEMLTFSASTNTAVARSQNIEITFTFGDAVGSTPATQLKKNVTITASTQGPKGDDGGYMQYMYLRADYGLTTEQLLASDEWQDTQPSPVQGKCIYMASKWIQPIRID